LSRAPETLWSRRRAGVRAEAEAERREAIADDRARIEAGQAQKSDADILAELSLQDPDQMQAGDDFAAFMRNEVPARLRNRALRTLWRSDPVLACVDDLVDYGDDFKAEWNATGVISTAYQVGKGMLAHVQEMQKQAEAETPAAPDEDAEASEAVEVLPDTVGPVATDEAALAVTAFEPQEDEPQFRPAPRMRFEFDEVT